MVEMELLGVKLDATASTPVVLLRETTGRRRLLPIYIGGPEAAAIAMALEGVVPPRPLTHDLFSSVLDELGVQLERVVVTEMVDHTYYAELHLSQNGTTRVVSSRPSDSIALAVRTGTSVFASEQLLDEVGQEEVVGEDDEEEEEQAEEILEEFRDFIENVNPEDFRS